MMRRFMVFALCAIALTACSGSEPDQEAIDAAVEKALAERDREDAERYRALPDEAKADGKTGNQAEPETKPASYSTENLREGYSDAMGSPYWMCTRTLSIVGEHCGCIVNRATDAGIPNAAQVGMFGGDGKRASKDQAARFTRIVRSCSGYNITVRGAGSEAPPPEPEAKPTQAAVKGRIVTCSFWNSVEEYDGRCRFEMGPGGDFKTTSLDGPYFMDVTRIDLDVTSKGSGTLIMSYPDGYVKRVLVDRSNADRACWGGPKIRFCAR